MRLAATLTTMRDAARQPVELRGTLRDSSELPRDVVILDVSTTGFRAELPADVTIEPGMRVRIAASSLGVHEAVAVRGGEDEGYGFAFARPIMLNDLDGAQPSSVTPFPGAPLPAMPAADIAAAPAGRPRISARASLAIMVGISCALWLALAAIVAAVSFLA